MGGRRRLALAASAAAAGSLPFLLGQAPAAAAIGEGEGELTFTSDGVPVTCRLFGDSSVLDGEGSASSATNGDQEPRCAAHLFVDVRYVDTGGNSRASGSRTFTGTDVEHQVDGVQDSFEATHTAEFLECEATDRSQCTISFTTSPK